MEPNYLALAAAVVAAFVLSGVWYAVFGNMLAALSPAYAGDRTTAATVAVELVRSGILVAVTAGLVDAADADTVPKALLLAVALWVGFPAVLLAGAVFHEKVPPALAAVHAGDWLVKLLAVATIVGAWQ